MNSDYNTYIEEARIFEDQVYRSIVNVFGATAEVMRDYVIDIGNGLRRRVEIAVKRENDIYLIEIYRVRARGMASTMHLSDRVQRLLTYATLSYQQQHTQSKLHPLIVVNIVDVSEKEEDQINKDDSELRSKRFFERGLERFRQELSAIVSLYGINSIDDILIDITDLHNPDKLRQKFENVPNLTNSTASKATQSQSKKHDVFISYRRSDSNWAAGRLADYLKTRFNSNEIFFDTQNIDLGKNFDEAIRNQITSSNIVLVVIGSDWLRVSDQESGIRRLDNNSDYVRMEVATALANDLTVIPILLDDTPMPNSSYLPDDLKLLSLRNAGRITADNFHSDVTRIETRLAELGVQRKHSRKSKSK